MEAKVKTEAVLLQAHHEEAWFFGKDSNTGKTKGSRKRGRANVSWTGYIKEATGMKIRELSRAAEDRISWTSLNHVASGVTANSTACNTNHFQIT